MMFVKKTFLKGVAVITAAFCVSLALVPTSSAFEDYSRAYQYGGTLRIPGTNNGAAGFGTSGSPGESGGEQRPILEVNSGFDAGGVLGCAGLDLSGMLQNTFNVGNLGDEFKNYLQNTIATEALSLLYSQPGVSQVLDGMKAIGHARVSIQQERCNANEIMANATNRRLRDEGHAQCIKEHQDNPDACTGSTLQGYVEEVAQSNRWSGTLHDHVCPDGPDQGVCQFLPNFAYDIGTGEGRATQAQVPPSVVQGQGEFFAGQCFEQRAQIACGLVSQYGYSEAMRRVASGDARISCSDEAVAAAAAAAEGGGAPAEGGGAPAAGGGAAPAEGGDTGGTGNNNPTPDPAAGLGVNADCELEVNGQKISADNVYEALTRGNLNPSQLIESNTQCMIAKEVHGHVDVNLCMDEPADALGMRQALAQYYGNRAAFNVYGALIMALSNAVIQSGGTESADPNQSMNPQTMEFIQAQIQALSAARDSLVLDQSMSTEHAEVMNRYQENRRRRQERNDTQTGNMMMQGANNAVDDDYSYRRMSGR